MHAQFNATCWLGHMQSCGASPCICEAISSAPSRFNAAEHRIVTAASPSPVALFQLYELVTMITSAVDGYPFLRRVSICFPTIILATTTARWLIALRAC